MMRGGAEMSLSSRPDGRTAAPSEGGVRGHVADRQGSKRMPPSASLGCADPATALSLSVDDLYQRPTSPSSP